MIIGVTGPIGAGTDSFGEILKGKGFVWFSYSDVLRDEMRKAGIPLERARFIEFANELRETKGAGIISEILADRIGVGNYVIGNIRNPEEVEVMRRKFRDSFVLVMIDASLEARFERVKERAREKDPVKFEEFVKLDRKDRGEGQPEHGQQHQRVFEMADFVIENNGSLDELREKVDELLANLR